MRVRKLIRDCRIVVRQGGKEIGAKKMKKALPAEMIQLTIKADKISSKDALEVSVEC